MLRFNIFKRIQHQSFNYIPRFYDPEKEALNKRLKHYESLSKSEQDIITSKERIKYGLRSKYRSPEDISYRKRAVRSSNIRLIIIIGILVMLCMMVLSSNKIDGVLSLLLKQ